MNSPGTGIFNVPSRLVHKSDPALIAVDEHHFGRLELGLHDAIAELAARQDEALRSPGGHGQKALDRDQDVHRISARLTTLRRFGADLCLGRMVRSDDAEPVYIGRLGLTDPSGGRLLVDWRSPAAEPFFGATRANPMGLLSRRRYRWTLGRITDYWDETFTPDGATDSTALDDESAFIASLGADRSPRMRDVLGTIAADQDAIVRAGSEGTLVVDGGPGTGKTVVALHRTAYLLYSDPRLDRRRGGVLFIGPHQPYLEYVSDVLPSLGEDGVRTCTLRDLVPEGVRAKTEPDARVAELKADARWEEAIETAVRFYEDPPRQAMIVSTEWSDVRLAVDDWTEAFETPDPGTSHNDARDEVWDAIVAILVDQHDDEVPENELRRSLERHEQLRSAFNRAWPVIDAADLVSDLWSVPAYLRRCAPWLGNDEVRSLQRATPGEWTVSDLPLLDAARMRLGDPKTARDRRRRAANLEAERARVADAVKDLLLADTDRESLVSMLVQPDLQERLVDDTNLAAVELDALAGPFAHVVVDEAQELTDAEWSMVRRRCPSRSLTVVGDRAQARHGFFETWPERLGRVGLDRITVASLRINYRTPEQVMAAAEPEIRAVLPDANVPTSIRRTDVPVRFGSHSQLAEVLDGWLTAHDEGIACVIGDPCFTGTARVRSLPPPLVKGLEFDLVVLVDPAAFGEAELDHGGARTHGVSIEGAVDRYVAMTRATQELVVLTSP